MKIVFMGTPDFAVTVLDYLKDAGHEILLAVTQPDKPKGRGNKMLPPEVKIKAQEYGIEVIQPLSVKDENFYQKLASLQADCFVVVAYGRILPENILKLPKYGAINVHGSLLPQYRGSAPIQRAIMNGERFTGVTIMQMDKGMDTGAMFASGEIPIEDTDTTGTMFEKLAHLGGKLLCEVLDKLENGAITAVAQDDTMATYAPPIQKEEEKIDWTLSANKVFHLIQAMAPSPCAYTFFNGERLKIGQGKIIDFAGKPGEVVEISKNGITIACGEGAILVEKLQPAGKKMITARDFINGSGIKKGMVLHE